MKQLMWDATSGRPQDSLHPLRAMTQEYLETDVNFLPRTSTVVPELQLPGMKMTGVLKTTT